MMMNNISPRYIESGQQHVKKISFEQSDLSSPDFLEQLYIAKENYENDITVEIDPKNFGDNVKAIYLYPDMNDYQDIYFVLCIEMYTHNLNSLVDGGDKPIYQESLEKLDGEEGFRIRRGFSINGNQAIPDIPQKIYRYLAGAEDLGLLKMNTTGQITATPLTSKQKDNKQISQQFKKKSDMRNISQKITQDTIGQILAYHTTQDVIKKIMSQK